MAKSTIGLPYPISDQGERSTDRDGQRGRKPEEGRHCFEPWSVSQSEPESTFQYGRQEDSLPEDCGSRSARVVDIGTHTPAGRAKAISLHVRIKG